MALKDNIKIRRAEMHYTLEDLAAKVGVSRQTIQRYESGVIGNIPSDKIEKIAEALETSPSYLMGWEENTESVLSPPAIDYAKLLREKGFTDDDFENMIRIYEMIMSKK